MSDLRPMTGDDIEPILEIIDAFDDEDAESARSFFESEGPDGHFVLEDNGAVIGVTGYEHVPATERTSWLSWTYLAEAHRGKGVGKDMLTQVLNNLREQGCRKVFVKVSDYMDDEDGPIYLPAQKAYESVGFELELRGLDFYDDGEDQLIMGLLLAEPAEAPEPKEERPSIDFQQLFEIADTEGTYTFKWFVSSGGLKIFQPKHFTAEDLTLGMTEVKKAGGRKVALTFPSNLPLIKEPLEQAGFKYIGKLKDYYEPALHELHFAHDLENL